MPEEVIETYTMTEQEVEEALADFDQKATKFHPNGWWTCMTCTEGIKCSTKEEALEVKKQKLATIPVAKKVAMKKVQEVVLTSSMSTKKPVGPPTTNVDPTPTGEMPDWEILMRTVDPKAFLCGAKPQPRSRRWSIHALAATCKREDPIALLEEMEKSGKVLGYFCPDVQCVIFYLKELRERMIDTCNDRCWKDARKDLADHPYPKVQGFRRFAYGKGYEMSTAFDLLDPNDAVYEKRCTWALANRTPILTKDWSEEKAA